MLGVLASATFNIALAETQIGQHVSTSYAMDTVDHFSGSVSFNATDYQIQLGPNSTYPLIRTIQVRGGSSHYTFAYTTAHKSADLYNIGQEVSDKDELKCISQLTDRKATNRFRTPGGETVVFHRVNLKEDTTDQYLSKSNWLLDCSPDRSEFSKQLISPNGMSYYYHQATGTTTMGSMLGGIDGSRYPDLIVDANGKEMTVAKDATVLTLTTQYQTITFQDQKLNVSGYNKPIVEFESVRNGFQVTYQNESGWLYKTEGTNKAKVCNPLNLCGTYEFDNVKIRGTNENRLVKKTYEVPHYGQYSVTYSYTGNQSSATTIAKYPDHQREYGFQYVKPSTNKNLAGIHWNQGLPTFERVWDLSKPHKYQEITYQHEASENTSPTGVDSQTRNDRLRYRVTPRMTEKTTQRWAKDTNGSYVWVGTVKERYSDFNDFNRPEKVSFSYPKQNGESLFPSVTYITKYDTTRSLHRTDLVKESYIEGLNERTINTYDDRGNLTSKDVNGVVTHYTYHSSGALSTQTDPNGNIRTYTNYDFGIPKTETGPEGFTVSRTVENGFTTSETAWGDRTVKYDYDPFGKLREFTPASESRLPIRYGYEFPSEGGLLLTESSGTKTIYTYLNGFGKP